MPFPDSVILKMLYKTASDVVSTYVALPCDSNRRDTSYDSLAEASCHLVHSQNQGNSALCTPVRPERFAGRYLFGLRIVLTASRAKSSQNPRSFRCACLCRCPIFGVRCTQYPVADEVSASATSLTQPNLTCPA